MFYQTNTPHGLPHDPFKALVTPRPIGWISTLSAAGVPNLAPFSFFNIVSDNPHMVMFSVASRNDTLLNIEETGEFTYSIVPAALTNQMNASSAAVERSVNEFELAGLATAPSQLVAPARVADSPAAFECHHWQSIAMPIRENKEVGYTMIIGEVLGIYINDDYLTDGRVDTAKIQPIARMGYMDYARVGAENTFSLNRPVVD